LEAVARERLAKIQQTGKDLAGAVVISEKEKAVPFLIKSYHKLKTATVSSFLVLHST
jgi:hypothetical protein